MAQVGGARARTALSSRVLLVRLQDEPATKEDEMQYVMLIYQGATPLPGTPEWETLPADEQKQVYADYAALNKTNGVTPGLPLGLAENATTVRVENGETLVTDGPFVGIKEAIGGFFVLEADDLDAAIELASRVPAARLGGAIEVRPVETYW
jgi:hypothetical protein